MIGSTCSYGCQKCGKQVISQAGIGEFHPYCSRCWKDENRIISLEKKVNALEALKIEPAKVKHPWGEFLAIRAKLIDYFHDENHYSDFVISQTLSMDEGQVRGIRTRNRNLDAFE